MNAEQPLKLSPPGLAADPSPEFLARSIPDFAQEMIQELKRIRRTLESQNSELLTPNEAARMLGISRATLDRMTSSGKMLRPVRLNGTSPRFRRRELQSWIDGGCLPHDQWIALQKTKK